MKKLLIIVQCAACLVLTTHFANAQNSAAPQAKISPDENALKPSNKPTTSDIKIPKTPTQSLQSPPTQQANSVTASPLNNDKNTKATELEKLKFKVVDVTSATTPLSAENTSTLNGTAKRPKSTEVSTITPSTTKPTPLSKPIIAKADGNQ